MNNKIRGRKATLVIIDDPQQEQHMYSTGMNVPGLPIEVQTTIKLDANALSPVDLNFAPFVASPRTYGGFTWWSVQDKRSFSVAMFTDQYSAEKVAAALDFYSKVAVVDPTYRA